MLGKDVERQQTKPRLSKTRFVLFIGLIVVATQWHQLQILPIFLGFLTTKPRLIVYMVETVLSLTLNRSGSEENCSLTVWGNFLNGNA